MRQRFRPVLVFTAALLPGVYGLVCACSLDLDESLIPTSEDAASGDVHGFGGSGWVDANGSDGPGPDGSGGASDANAEGDVSDATGEGGAPAGIDCDPTSCDAGSYCCFESAGGVCAKDPATCTSVAIGCDSTTDCVGGDRCCLVDSDTVACQPVCPDVPLQGPTQFCKLNSECEGSGVCGPLPPLLAALLPPSYKSCQ